MKELFDTVRNWPVILQGALGSALFWLFLTSAQSLFEWITDKYSEHSITARRSWLISQLIKYEAFQPGDHAKSSFYVSTVIYRSLRFLYKGVMWLCMGLILQAVIAVSGIIGFAGCLFYLFKAYEVVKPYEDNIDLEMEADKCRQELQELGVLQNDEKN